MAEMQCVSREVHAAVGPVMPDLCAGEQINIALVFWGNRGSNDLYLPSLAGNDDVNFDK